MREGGETDGQTERHDGGNRRFSRLCYHAKKCSERENATGSLILSAFEAIKSSALCMCVNPQDVVNQHRPSPSVDIVPDKCNSKLSLRVEYAEI